MTAHNHHYLSQCYLKGFTNGGTKNSKLTVLDLEEKKQFETIPRNVGSLRDFNRIDMEGVDPNILENSFSKFEGEVALAINKLRKSAKLEGEIKAAILKLVALFAVRSPRMREHLRKFEATILERATELALASKKRWHSTVRQMKESGTELNDNVTYEDVRKFYESKEYTIEVAREHHILMELRSVERIFPTLASRKWAIVRASNESGPFITTDRPVSLTWKEYDKVPPFERNIPGHGMSNTQLCFPLSTNTALIGEFDGYEGVIDGTRELVALFNSKMLIFAEKQIYVPNLNFNFLGNAGETLEGVDLLKYITA